MYIGYLPYLRIRCQNDGSAELWVGKARFLPDDDEVWANVIKQPRPSHFDIFRRLPPLNQNVPGEPIRGTVVISDDELWLRQFMDEAVATVYFLGDTKNPGRPAECFAHQLLRTSNAVEKPNAVISFVTKHGEIWETKDSIVVYPPLVTRGKMGDYEIDTESPPKQKLLKLIADNPRDRLIVAVRQYFRTQFSDAFTSTDAEDYAAHCSVIEAALNLDTRHTASEKFVAALTDIYGEDDIIKNFFRGLYVSRSLYVHGAGTHGIESADSPDAKAFRYFQSRHGRLTALRYVSRDLIHRALWKNDSYGYRFGAFGSAARMLASVLESDLIWADVRKLLTQAKAADSIMTMDDEQFKSVMDLMALFDSVFNWECVTEPVVPKHLYMAIGTCALLVTKLANGNEEVITSAVKLGKASDEKDGEEIADWLFENYEWGIGLHIESGRLPVIQSLARILASYFENHEVSNV